ncbi:MAG: dockerin [Polyangiaceae bacterium]
MKNYRAIFTLSLLAFVASSAAIGCSSDKDKVVGEEGGAGQGGAGQGGAGQGGAAQGGDASGGKGNGGDGAGTGGAGGTAMGGAPVTLPPDTSVPPQPWDITGVIGSGQSLAVGAQGKPVISTSQPYQNLKLSTGTLPWPVDPANDTLALVPLTEPVGRQSTAYPSSWPTNIDGETAHTSMASQVTAMVQTANGGNYVGLHGEFGESGQCLTYLVKDAVQSGVNGRAYAATLVETQAVTRLAKASGKTYGVGAMIMTHGECDASNKSYEEQLYKLLNDYNTDIASITGQTQRFPMIISQQNSIGAYSSGAQAQWIIGVHHPEDVVCSGPKYHLPYAADGVHLTAEGYRRLGEKYGQVYYERVVQMRNWQPLQPTQVERDGQTLIVHFHVPVPPLTWETAFPAPNADAEAWKSGKGFEVQAPGKRITISSVEIAGDTVRISCADPLPATGVKVGYAMLGNATAMKTDSFSGTTHWGLLRDSDPFVGSVTGKAQPNYAVAFFMDVP